MRWVKLDLKFDPPSISSILYHVLLREKLKIDLQYSYKIIHIGNIVRKCAKPNRIFTYIFYYCKVLLFTAEMRREHLPRNTTPFPLPSLHFHSSGFTYLLLPFCQFLFKCESWYSGFLMRCGDRDVTTHGKSSEIR